MKNLKLYYDSCQLQRIYIQPFYFYFVVHNQSIFEDLLLLENSINGNWLEGVVQYLRLNRYHLYYWGVLNSHSHEVKKKCFCDVITSQK